MKCKRCLMENADDAAFCQNCGQKLSPMEGTEFASGQTEANERMAGEANGDAAAQGETFVEAEPVVEEAAASSDIPNPGPKQPEGISRETSCEGILTMAWHDVRTSKGWFGKTALLALINLVPILNFVVYGYCLRWGRLASFKKASKDPMPPVLITSDYFKMGFFTAVVMLCWSLVISIVCAIPLVGIVISVLTVFAVPMIYMCLQRMNLLNSFGAGFQLKDIWEKYRRNLGGALAITWLPALLVMVVILAIALAMVLVFGISAYGIVSGYYLLRALGIAGIVAVLVACYVIFMASVVAALVVFRAFGYWTVRVAPEWIDETYVAAGMNPPAR